MEGNYDILVKELCKLPKETGWVEFKHNNDDPKMIGEDVCALANTATLKDHDFAYMIWGVDDTTHDIIGTSVRLVQLKKGQEDIENWLRHQLSRNANFEFLEAETDGKHIEIIRVHKALHIPVAFEKTEYIRSGSYTKKLNDYPELMAQLWDKLRNSRFEDVCPIKDLRYAEVLQMIDAGAYFSMLNIPHPTEENEVMHYLVEDGIVVKLDNGLFGITNLGAILFAKDLNNFP